MFTHVMIGWNDKVQSLAFYDATFGALGVTGQHHDNGAFYGSPQTGMFGLGKPRDGEPATHANGGTIGLAAANPAAVDAWHAAGLANGGTCDGEPGRRDYGPQPMYGAYMRDPVGNKLCAFTVNVEG
ncbi:MAG TPA: VOC family protein [Paracoccaceae bacterium]|nr:VOC family protein [Paracoccaceae bacterium]